MYTILRKGCVQPAVTAVQILLNRTRGKNRIAVDGHYGVNTQAAVLEFQRLKHLKQDGEVGMYTWAALTKESGLKVIDAVDVTDPNLFRTTVSGLVVAGGNPIVAGGMCGGVDHVVSAILKQAGQSGSTVILRFLGHGDTAGQYITGGRYIQMPSGEQVRDGGRFRNAIFQLESRENITELESVLTRLRTIFVRFGCVEMHACEVGEGPKGFAMLEHLARIFHVPVAGGVKTQYVGGSKTFQFEGPVVTAVPFGGDLKGWSETVAASE